MLRVADGHVQECTIDFLDLDLDLDLDLEWIFLEAG